MSGRLKFLGIIPARGGSKGIPKKNIKMLAGKPMIAWTIESALNSSGIDRLIVSTDDSEIAEISMKSGAEVPFLRPDTISTDISGSVEVVVHALRYLESHENYIPDYTMLLQPTSPLRSTFDIDQTLQSAEKQGYTSIVSVSETRFQPNLIKTITPSGIIKDVYPDTNRNSRRQDFPTYFILNGAIYLNKTSVLSESNSFVQPDSRAYIMPPERSIDIDTPWDFFLADLLLSNRPRKDQTL